MSDTKERKELEDMLLWGHIEYASEGISRRHKKRRAWLGYLVVGFVCMYLGARLVGL